jgi:DNA-binding winged helix-turn-helix (wHTH) protein
MTSATAAKPGAVRRLRFGVFEVDLQERELRKRGLRVKLQQKPFQVLELLLRVPGRLVSRAEMAQELWPELHVSQQGSLNTAVNALRRALGDEPQNPRFIETRPGIGYRFLAPVEVVSDQPDDAPAPNPEAQQDYLKGRFFQQKLIEESLHKSVAYFQSALAQDPNFGRAKAGLADTYCLFAMLDMLPSREAYPRAKDLALQAVNGRGPAEAHAALAGVKRMFEWDWIGAEREYLTALDLSADCVASRQGYAGYLAAAGRPEEALEQLERARELDPLSLRINLEIAWTRYLARDFQTSVEQSWKVLVMEPELAAAQHTLGLAYEQLGMIEEAIVELQNARRCSGDRPSVVAALAHAQVTGGQLADAALTVAELEEMSRRRPVAPCWRALAHAATGDSSRALEELESACQERDIWLTWIKADPRFETLRLHAQCRDLLQRIGLEPAVS